MVPRPRYQAQQFRRAEMSVDPFVAPAADWNPEAFVQQQVLCFSPLMVNVLGGQPSPTEDQRNYAIVMLRLFYPYFFPSTIFTFLSGALWGASPDHSGKTLIRILSVGKNQSPCIPRTTSDGLIE